MYMYEQVPSAFDLYQESMSMKIPPPYTPLSYSKTGVYRGIPIFLIFDPKHRLWVLIINVLSTSIKNFKIFLMKFSVFKADKNSLYIAWSSFRNVSGVNAVRKLLAGTKRIRPQSKYHRRYSKEGGVKMAYQDFYSVNPESVVQRNLEGVSEYMSPRNYENTPMQYTEKKN